MSVSRHHFIAPLAACLLLLTAACGGDDGSTEAASEAPNEAPADSGSEEPDASTGSDASTDTETDAAGEDEGEDEGTGDLTGEGAAPVCDLLTDEEIAGFLGYEVASKTPDTMALPTCEWELEVPADEQSMNLPVAVLTLLPQDEYTFRVDPIRDILTPVDGVGDEALMGFAGAPDDGIQNMVQFYALDGDQGFVFIPGLNSWETAGAAQPDLAELGQLVFERI